MTQALPIAPPPPEEPGRQGRAVAGTAPHFLAEALDQVSEAVYLADRQGGVRYANDPALRTLGVALSDLGARTLADLDPDWSLQRWQAVWRESHARPRVVTGHHRRRDGTIFPVEIALRSSSFEGEEYRLLIVRDLTSHRRMEAELHARAEEFRALVADSPDVVIRYDRDCRRLFANASLMRLTGTVAPHELLGKRPTENAPALSQPPLFEAAIRQAFATGETQELLFPTCGPRGGLWARARFVPERDAAGAIVSVLAVGHDVTELIEAQQELRRRNREQHLLALCRRIMMDTADEPSLLEGFCRLLCDEAGYRLAWIGYLAPESPATLRPAAWAGQERDDVADPRIAWSMETPAGVALRTGAVRAVQEIGAETEPADWREGSLQRGYRAALALPLGNGETPLGVVMLYAADAGVFSREETELITGLVAECAFGISALRQRAACARADESLQHQEQKYRTIFNDSPLGLFRATFDGRLLEANPALAEMFGYPSPESMRELDIISRISTAPETHPALICELLAAPDTTRHETRFRRRDGSDFNATLLLKTIRGPDGSTRFLEGIVEDITARSQTELAMRRLNRALKTLSSGNEALVRATHELELLEKMCRTVVEVGGYRFAWIGFAAADGTIAPRAFAGQEQGFLAVQRRHCGEDPVCDALRSGRARVTHSFDALDLQPGFRAELERCDFRACAAFPLHAGDEPGVLAIYSADREAFDPDEVRLLTEMSEDLTYGIHALRLRNEREESLLRLRASMESTIEALSATVELRDPYTAGHQRRVAKLATALARRMDWTDEEIQAMYLAGMVHDIGKIAVPAEILNKPGRLTEAEMMLVRTHPDAGFDILKSVDLSWPVAQIVHQHHERLDGSGYPLGLQGDQICMEARILAVCDVVEAMTGHRPYRRAFSLEVALQEIEQGKGTRFDAVVVDICVDLLRNHPQEWSEETSRDLATPLP